MILFFCNTSLQCFDTVDWAIEALRDALYKYSTTTTTTNRHGLWV